MEKPILFNTEMVKAILEDKKTMTRRVFPLKHYPADNYVDLSRSVPEIRGKYQFLRLENGHEYGGPINCPYGQVGDILWVRETWCKAPLEYLWKTREWKYGYAYKADGDSIINWKPSIHMPRLAARLFLKVKEIRVERLQDITEEDARAEGVQRLFDDMSDEDYERWSNNLSCKGFEAEKKKDQTWKNYLWHGRENLKQKQIDGWPYQYSAYKTCKESFSSLWELINSERGYGWDVNPWVWAVTFERVEALL